MYNQIYIYCWNVDERITVGDKEKETAKAKMPIITITIKPVTYFESKILLITNITSYNNYYKKDTEPNTIPIAWLVGIEKTACKETTYII